MTRRARSILLAAGSLHFLHDGFSDVLYVLLPVWAGAFGLSLAQVGVMRTVYTGGMSLFQIPAGFLAERWGERLVLAAGTALTAVGFLAVGMAGGFVILLAVLVVAGVGSGVQHPLSSSLVAKAYEDGPRRAALGTYNFAGDLGKVAVPATVGVATALVGWRAAAAGYGAVGLVAAVGMFIVLSRLGAGDAPERPARGAAATPAAGGWGIRDLRGFQALSAIGMVDGATRSALLTFLPFVLVGKGLSVAGVGGALALVFAGGALGKFVCGIAAERIGLIRTVVLTEAATTAGILLVLASPLPVAMTLLLPLGVALNGTSSVLYATVADLVTSDRRSRAYGLYYTLGIGASAVAPALYGVVGDAIGVTAALIVAAALVLVTIPLCLGLRSAVQAPAGA